MMEECFWSGTITREQRDRMYQEIVDTNGERITCPYCGARRMSRMHAYDPKLYFFCINGCGGYFNITDWQNEGKFLMIEDEVYPESTVSQNAIEIICGKSNNSNPSK